MVATFALDSLQQIVAFDTTYFSTDNGQHWTRARGLPDSVYLSEFTNAGSALVAAGGWGGLFRSTDQGISWARSSDLVLDTVSVNSLTVSGTELFAGTNDGVFLSTNEGLTWTAENQGFGSNLQIASVAANSNYLFATKFGVGNLGTPGVWRQPLSDFSEVRPNAISDFQIHNYPNPFDGSTTIEYTLPSTSPVLLRVYNELGKQVATLVNGMANAGEHRGTFSGTGLPAGMYEYRLNAGAYSRSGIMTLEHSGFGH